jgi:hypothetical protein
MATINWVVAENAEAQAADDKVELTLHVSVPGKEPAAVHVRLPADVAAKLATQMVEAASKARSATPATVQSSIARKDWKMDVG